MYTFYLYRNIEISWNFIITIFKLDFKKKTWIWILAYYV